MNLCRPRSFSCLFAGAVLFCLIPSISAQTTYKAYSSAANVDILGVPDLPDAPQPMTRSISSDAAREEIEQSASQAPTSSGSSSTGPTPNSGQQTHPGIQATPQSEHDLAEEQLKQQQKQRVLGIVPNFNTSYIYGAAPLSAKQKFSLAFRSQIDPAAFGVSGFVALIEQAEGSHYAYGGGWGGYGKRYGQTYADSFDGQMIGNAVLPALLHQDPRYFRLGRGSAKRRILYALGTNVIAHHDGTGRWEPNYSNVLGNFAAGGISNIYLPTNERGFGSTITGGLVVLAEGGVGSMFQEFWPDIARHYLHRDPTNGQDAINKLQPDPTAGEPLFHNPPKIPKAYKTSKAQPDGADAPK